MTLHWQTKWSYIITWLLDQWVFTTTSNIISSSEACIKDYASSGTWQETEKSTQFQQSLHRDRQQVLIVAKYYLYLNVEIYVLVLVLQWRYCIIYKHILGASAGLYLRWNDHLNAIHVTCHESMRHKNNLVIYLIEHLMYCHMFESHILC